MKFACEQCKTKYSIADERVRGKVLKIRCKNCGHVMTVRDEAQPRGKEKGVLERAMDHALEAPPSSAFQNSDATIVGSPEAVLGTLMNPPMLDLEEWHISVDGVAQGPLKLEALAQRIVVERAAGDGELFVWRDGFDDWLAPREVPEVRVAVERLRPGLPANFWGSPEPLFPSAPRSEVVRSTHPVERIESFEFTDTPPTISVPRKTTAALAKELQRGEPAQKRAPSSASSGLAALPLATPPLPAKAPEPRRAQIAPARISAPPLPGPLSGTAPLPPAPGGPLPGSPSSIESISEALAHLDEDDLLPEDMPPPSGLSVELNISEPSQMIDLRALALAMPPSQLSPEIPLPGLENPPPPAAPSVMVMTGPAPAAPGRHLKTILGGAIAACVLLTCLVAYLLLHRPAGDRAQGERPGEGKAVTDRPVVVHDEPPQPGQGPAQGGDAKKGGPAVTKKPVKLPAAAAGRTQLNGNAEALAKLYGQDGSGEKAPSVPAGSGSSGAGQGGGVSTAELQDVMRRNQKSLSVCYERVLKHDESLRRARIDVQVRVGQTGTVTHVSIGAPYGSSELGTCMQQTIRRWHFPPSDADYETQFPLILTAN